MEALQAADVFLLASLSEGFSTATLEAMAVALPVVVTDVGGMREAVTDGIEGRGNHLAIRRRSPQRCSSSRPTHNSVPRWASADGDERANDFDRELGARAMLEQYQRLVRERPRSRDRATRS